MLQSDKRNSAQIIDSGANMRTNNCGQTFVAAAEELHRLVVSRTGCQHRRPFRSCFALVLFGK